MILQAAALQLVSCADIDTNLAHCETLLATAAIDRARIVVLPENAFCYGCPMEVVATRQQEIKTRLGAWAKTYKLWLVGGSLPWLDTEFAAKPSASCFVFNPEGEEVLHYRKMHLFDADVADATGSYRESDSYSAGNSLGTFDTPWGKFGVAICYDLRFPECFRALAEAGVVAVFIPAAFTYVTGEAHWEILLRARAIENQMFMIAANQGGEHSNKRKTWGQSMIVDPWGRVLKEAALGEAIVSTELNFEELTDIRKKMPVLNHRKL